MKSALLAIFLSCALPVFGQINNPGSSGGSGSPGSPTNSVQSNCGGSFCGNANVQEDTTNGYLGVNSPAGLPTSPAQVKWTGLSRAGNAANPLNIATFEADYSSTSASPGDIHVVNIDSTLSGSDALAFTDGTNALLYLVLNDNRAPVQASTIGHQLGIASRVNFNGGTNLTSTVTAAYYSTSGFNGSGGSATLYGYDNEGGTLSGTGTIPNWYGVATAIPSVASGTGPNYNNGTGLAVKTSPSTVQHGNGSGCIAGVAVGSGQCNTSGGFFEFFTDDTSPNAFLGSLSVGKQTAPTKTLDVNGPTQLGSTSAAQSDVTLTSKNNGSVVVTLKMPLGNPSSISLKWPDISGTFATTTGNYDNSSGITGNLSAQALFTAPDSSARYFDASAFVECTASVAGSTVTVNFNFTDDIGATSLSSSALSCATSGTRYTFASGFWSAGGANVTVSTTTASSPQYKFHAQATDHAQSTNST